MRALILSSVLAAVVGYSAFLLVLSAQAARFEITGRLMVTGAAGIGLGLLPFAAVFAGAVLILAGVPAHDALNRWGQRALPAHGLAGVAVGALTFLAFVAAAELAGILWVWRSFGLPFFAAFSSAGLAGATLLWKLR